MAAPRKLFPLVALVVMVGCGGPELDTRTFRLNHIHGSQAEDLIRPYVFSDRPDAPGQMSSTSEAITVRETPDNLERIARVLAEHDKPLLTARLHFQIIQADGAARPDPAIAEVETVLRQLFRFRGYRLIGEAVITGMPFSDAQQDIAGEGGPYGIFAGIKDIRGTADSGVVRVNVALHSQGVVLQTTVSLRSGHTAVLGNARIQADGRTVILVVRPELVAN